MSVLNFCPSSDLSLGVEIELQIVNTHDYNLTPVVSTLLAVLKKENFLGEIKEESASSMLEFSTTICHSYSEVLEQLQKARDTLVNVAKRLNVMLCGGGTHPFQHWSEQTISDAPRFHMLSELYGYLLKQFTIFGQHVHIGCRSSDTALRLMHSLSRFIPHFIALSASSPYVQGIDTGFQSARLNSVSAFPLSGIPPFVLSWTEFEHYFNKMLHTGVVKSMKDFYWDIRPKPEFGTVEVRVMDTPLTVERAAAISGYIQALSCWIMEEIPFVPEENDYLVYAFNRFQACRFGMNATYVESKSGKHILLQEHILSTLEIVKNYSISLGAGEACDFLYQEVLAQSTDASQLRTIFQKEKLLPEVVRQQCLLFSGVAA